MVNTQGTGERERTRTLVEIRVQLSQYSDSDSVVSSKKVVSQYTTHMHSQPFAQCVWVAVFTQLTALLLVRVV